MAGANDPPEALFSRPAIEGFFAEREIKKPPLAGQLGKCPADDQANHESPLVTHEFARY
jgi:hypothetical protein